MRAHTRLVLINLIGVLCILTGSAGLVLQANRFRADWRTLQNDVEVRADALERVQRAIGYGGMIHALKNYVLRRDPAYERMFDDSVRVARDGIELYRTSGDLGAHERADLERLEELVGRYEAAMRRARGSSLAPAELDAQIRIDDGPYFESLERLGLMLEARRQAITTGVDEGLGRASVQGAWLGVVGAGLVLGLGGFLAYRVGRRLERSVEERELANRERTRFLANMSHEIRTPLGALLGFTELARDASEHPEERRNYLDRAHSAGRILLDLINNALDLTKLEAGQMEIQRAPVALASLLAEVESIAGASAHEKGLTLASEMAPGTPGWVVTDPVRVRQVLVNLVGNAVKFTPRGGVRVVASYRPTERGGGTLSLSVHDTGIGIDERALASIFSPFTQADGTTTRRFGGTGLGLHISGRLAEVLGGRIEVRSTPGEGSEFTLIVPVREASAPRVSPARPARHEPSDGLLAGVRVLLAEDGPDNRFLIERFLRSAGAQVETACDGAEAIERLGSDQVFDIVLMDMQMPRVDGYEATRCARKIGYAGPIIALTAHAMSEDRQACLDAGCDAYAPKPIDRADLIAVCAQHASSRRAA